MPAGIALIAVLACIVYLPSINGDFILDDDVYVTNNQIIKSSDGLYRFWFTTEPIDYWPVTNTMFWIEWRVWGMNPAGYRVVNLILHVVETLLIWFILRKLSIPGAFLAAMIFAVHPVNVQTIAWIAQLKNVLCMLFFLLLILCYLQAETQPSSLKNRKILRGVDYWYGLSLVLFILAILSKGSVVILPVMLLGIIWWRRKSIITWDVVGLAPFFLASVGFTMVNMWFQTHGVEEVLRKAGFLERLLGAGSVVWFYLYKALLPINLSFIYPQWNIQVNNPLWWLPLLATLAFTAMLWWYRNSWSRPFLIAWGFFCVALVPVMGFTYVGFMQFSLVSDHYQHIAIIGVIALVAAGFGLWRQRARGKMQGAAISVAILAMVALAFLTWQQNRIYRYALTLYRATLKKNPNCWAIENNLSTILIKMGQFEDAIAHCEHAIRVKSDYDNAYNNLGLALDNVGQTDKAMENYKHALSLNPNFAQAHYNLGIVLFKMGRVPKAIESYEQAIRIKPDYAAAHNNLAIALVKIGRNQEAIDHFEQALRLQDDYPMAEYNLGIALGKLDRLPEAIKHYENAIRLKPDYTAVYYNLALAYANMNKPSEAIAAAKKGLELARSQGATAKAKQFEDWLNSYRANPSDQPDTSPPSKSAAPLL